MSAEKKLSFLVVLFCCLSFVPNFIDTAEADNPVSRWADLKFITTDNLKGLYDSGSDFLLINTLSPIEFSEITIKGSINIPYDDVKTGKTALPTGKDKQLIFFCKGPK